MYERRGGTHAAQPAPEVMPMKNVVRLLLVLVAVCSASAEEFVPVRRQPIIRIQGANIGGTNIHGLAVGWSMKRPYVAVSIAAHLSNGGGYAGGTAILTRKLGPHSGSVDEVARKEFELPEQFCGMFPLFEGLDLAAGEYWLVFEAPRDGRFTYANWSASIPFSLSCTRGTGYLGTTTMQAAEYGLDHRYGYQFEVIGQPVPLLKDEDPGRATLR
jgi:hypothetical protein